MARPRKTKRYKFKPTIDRGTEELRRHRLEASGDPNVAHDYPLEVMHRLGIITESQARAGQELCRLRHRVYGQPNGWACEVYKRMVAGFYIASTPMGPGSDRDEWQARLYRDAIEALRRAGSVQLHAVMRCAVYFETPNWVRRVRLVSPTAEAERLAICEGLTALARHFGHDVARAALK
jgi:hypothetical protein